MDKTIKKLKDRIKKILEENEKKGAKITGTGQKKPKETSQSGKTAKGKRHKNRIPDKGEPNTVKWNSSGTTAKKYGKDDWVEKEFNQGHAGNNVPDVEKSDHIHDWKPNPHHPEGRPTRQEGRLPTKLDYDDFNIDS